MRKAPVTAILGYDLQFCEQLPNIFPVKPEAQNTFSNNEALAQANAFRDGTLQAAYSIIAARAVGSDIGAILGFDNAGVD